MLGEGLDQHLLVLGAAAHQRAHDTGGLGVLQHHVDVGVADPALQGRALELQAQHRHVLDMDRQQEHPRATLDQVRHAAVSALQFALVEGRDGVTQRSQIGIRTVRLGPSTT